MRDKTRERQARERQARERQTHERQTRERQTSERQTHERQTHEHSLYRSCDSYMELPQITNINYPSASSCIMCETLFQPKPTNR